MTDAARAERLGSIFEPYDGVRRLPRMKNRIVFAPCTRWLTPGGLPHSAADSMASYYAARARHVGLVVTEGVYLNLPGASPHPSACDFHGAALEQWRDTVDAVHAAGGLIAPQVHHTGIQRRSAPGDPAMSPSGVSLRGKEVKGCAPMTLADIAQFRDAYVQAARDCQRLGFDAIAIHAAHGYLMHQFLWPVTNRRRDQYGGSPENRRRFLVEVIAAIRAAVPGLCVMLRFSQFPPRYDERAGPPAPGKVHRTPAELGDFVRACADAGVDLFDCSTEQWWVPEWPELEPATTLAGWTQRLSGRPACCGGSVGMDLPMGPTPSYITDVADAEARFTPACLPRLDDLAARVRAGEADLCFVGRALLADAEWPQKVREGRFGELTAPYNRGTLMRFAEGNHPVPTGEYAGVVRPVDAAGKPLSLAEAKRAKRVFWPTSIPEALWRPRWEAKL